MSESAVYLAVDLGAGSGRVIAGVVSQGKLTLDEINRFENQPLENEGKLHWNFEHLWTNIVEGIRLSVEKFGSETIRSIGVDTWGVDYAFLDENNEMLGGPRHYRDDRTTGAMDKVFGMVSSEEIFARTGIQFMELNTIFQMAVEHEDSDSKLPVASKFLLIPDLINKRLTGKAVCERTNASTTQLYDPVAKEWATSLFEAIKVDPKITPDLIDPGTSLGPVLPEIAEKTGLGSHTQVVTVGSHDTASAVAAVPVKPETKFAYLSSGTWSLLGVEIDTPVIAPLTQEFNFTNEVGVCDTIRLLKNINGLWLVQECRRVWAEQGNDIGYGELAALSKEAKPLVSLINPDEERFAHRGNMPQMIQDFCRETGQTVPETPGEIIRVIADSLAMKIRCVLGKLEQLIGHEVEILHIIGGGGQDENLNQSIASSINRPVIVGPFEATAAGNLMMQMVAAGDLTCLSDGRALIRKSFETKGFDPVDPEIWDQAYERFGALV